MDEHKSSWRVRLCSSICWREVTGSPGFGLSTFVSEGTRGLCLWAHPFTFCQHHPLLVVVLLLFLPFPQLSFGFLCFSLVAVACARVPCASLAHPAPLVRLRFSTPSLVEMAMRMVARRLVNPTGESLFARSVMRRRMSDGRILNEEEKAAENVYIKVVI